MPEEIELTSDRSVLQIYSDPRLLRLGVVHGTASRKWGNMRTPENVQNLMSALHIPPDKLLRFHQTHSDVILHALTPEQTEQIRLAPTQDADGWIIRGRGVGAAILTADCVPLFIWDEEGELLGLAHCGWRGVAKGLPAKLAAELKQAGAKGRLNAWIGPHIQSCCFEVQQDVAQQFPPACVLHKNGKTYVDLNAEILRQLAEQGLAEQDVKAPYHCTCGNRLEFFSYRRDHAKDALLSFVYRP